MKTLSYSMKPGRFLFILKASQFAFARMMAEPAHRLPHIAEIPLKVNKPFIVATEPEFLRLMGNEAAAQLSERTRSAVAWLLDEPVPFQKEIFVLEQSANGLYTYKKLIR